MSRFRVFQGHEVKGRDANVERDIALNLEHVVAAKKVFMGNEEERVEVLMRSGSRFVVEKTLKEFMLIFD